jgi:hypothetical protein
MPVSRRDFEDAVAAYWGAKQTQNEHINNSIVGRRRDVRSIRAATVLVRLPVR